MISTEGKESNSFDKFLRLHVGEESLRRESLARIAVDSDLRLHARTIECGQDLLDKLIHDGGAHEEDALTIRLLGIRLFNSCAGSIKLLLSGYYQNAAILLRDILETTFLLDYFLTNPALIAEWRLIDAKQRTNKFGPAVVRRALDDRDGFTERKREAHYKLLCELAAHPTNVGFKMLLADGINAHCGPFLRADAMKAAMEELANLQMLAVGTFMRLIGVSSHETSRAKLDFLEARLNWRKRSLSKELHAKEIEEIEEMQRRVISTRESKNKRDAPARTDKRSLCKLDPERMSAHQWVVC